jgi:predicted RNase H-like HicB family nuclease
LKKGNKKMNSFITLKYLGLVEVSIMDDEEKYTIMIPDLNYVSSYGKNIEEAKLNIQEACSLFLEDLDAVKFRLPSNMIETKEFTFSSVIIVDVEVPAILYTNKLINNILYTSSGYMQILEDLKKTTSLIHGNNNV